MPAARISPSARSVVSGATPAHSSSSTVVANPAAAASSAVARTQWSVAMPTTSTSVTPRSVSQSRSSTPRGVWPSKPE